jgi:uncharacterized OB-fold protein
MDHAENRGTPVQKALAPDVSTWPDDNFQLVGSRCGNCGATTWPRQSRCPRCSRAEMSDILLPRRGTVVTWTTQEFLPKPEFAGGQSAETFAPFAVGLVELGDDVRVEARLTEKDPDKIRFGMEVELGMVPFFVDEEGNEIVTIAFAPV